MLIIEAVTTSFSMGLYERETVGAVGPLTNYAGNDQQVLGEYKTKEEYLELAEQVCLRDGSQH